MSQQEKNFAVSSVCLSLLAFLLFILPSTRGFMRPFFFAGGSDFWADFLNVINSQTLSVHFNPYHCWIIDQSEQIYPPFAYVVCLPFARLMPQAGMTLAGCYASPIAMLVGFVAVALMSAVFFASTWAACRRFGLASWMALVLFAAGQVFWCIERGNLILLAISGILVFLSFYDTKSSMLRFFAAVGLSVAVALKVTPVLFGILWLNRRDLRWLALAGTITLVISFLPLFWSDYTIVDNITQLLCNVTAHERIYVDFSFTIAPACILRMLMHQALGLEPSSGSMVMLTSVVRGACLIVGICAIVLAVYNKIPLWQRFFLLASGQVLIPSAPQQYVLLFFIPSLIALIASSCPQSANAVFDWSLPGMFIIILYVVVMLPFPIFVFKGICVNFAVQSCLVLIGTSVLIVNYVVKTLNGHREKVVLKT